MFRRKKEKPELNMHIASGVYVERPQSRRRQNAFLSCLPKGILVFLVVFGSLGGFASAFEMECNYIIPGVVLFVSAMYFSGLFAFKKSYWKDLGYILYFIFYVMTIVLFKSYVNSGFAAIINVVKQQAEVYFGLNTGTEFSERIDDRYMTITITLIFIGIVEIIVLNIFVSNYMSLKIAVFMSLPIYVIPLYLQQEPNVFFVLCMLCGLAGIYIFKNSGHFKDGESRQGYEKTEKKKRRKKDVIPEIAYTQNNKVYRGILLGVLSCALFIGMCTVFFDAFDFRRTYVENRYKEATREGVSGFVMMGFRSFYRNAYSRGGMSGGELGNLAALRPDNQTDLVVRFAPYSASPVYLKGYTGIRYGDNRWLDGYQMVSAQRGKSPYFYIESMAEEAAQLADLQKKDAQNQAKAVMEIENKGANVEYVYYPYFTKFDDYKKYIESEEAHFTGSPLGVNNRFTFYPNLGYQADIEDFTSYIYEEVPDWNKDSLDRFIAAAGLEPVQNKANVEHVVSRVVEYFEEEYSYSYNPGRVPPGNDFVNYFLDDNKKGVCSHFASAATLVFRRLGIPARYIEGYAFGYNTILGGEVREDLKYEDYYSGPSELGETAVMEVEVTDANAHAWVEIYVQGKGWMVVDPTPSVIEEGSGGDFWGSLTNFWQNSPDLRLDGDLSEINLSFLNSSGARLTMVFILMAALLVLGGWLIGKQIVRWKSWHSDNLGQNLLWYYRDVCRRRGRRDEVFGRLTVPSEQLPYLLAAYSEDHRGADAIDGERVVRCLEKICFSPSKPEREEYEYVLGVLRKLR